MTSLSLYRFLPLCAALIYSTLVHAQTAKPTPALRVAADRPHAIYQQGETVTFEIKASPEAKLAPDAEIAWTITKDGVPPTQSGRIKLTDGVGRVTAKLQEAGFLLCRASVNVAGKPVAALGGAGIDPTKIAPSLPVPADFEAFWNGQKEKLAAVPPKAQLTPVTPASAKAVAFDLQVDALGAPVSGYFAKPIDAKPKSLPIVLLVHGAGVRSASLGSAVSWADRGMLAMDINAHGIPNGKPDTFYQELNDGPLRDYRAIGRETRETCYFTAMFLRLVRALDFLCAQPEWDGKTVVVYGTSQGGFQAFAAAALDARVTFFAAGVPAGCDHSGMVVNRVAGWPKIVPVVEGKPDAAALEATRYVDNVNFAAKTKAKGAFVTVGFVDTTCPPTSVYAAFNALPIADKKIFNDIPGGHSNSPAATAAMVESVAAHVKAQAAKR